ncbi:SCO2322 family protein [Streptomyces sp. NPDC050428]|uniref:SCO2322 family protein n=1 Tax=Streptomyces sp. NPDC050428 TaxID=3155757 RepID=UPI00343F6ED1
MRRVRIPGRRVVVPLVAAVLLASTGTGTAHAAGYRYWSFWENDGTTWTYATQGPALARPADGTVNGFRFAVSADSQDAAKPREAPDFAAVCGSTPAKSGSKRVAVVVDPGTEADAPDGEKPPAPRAECARVDADATSADALAAVAKPLRYNGDALLCGITGYPKSGCGEQISADGAASPTPTPSRATGALPKDDAAEDTPSLGILAGAAAVTTLATAALWQARRRRA